MSSGFMPISLALSISIVKLKYAREKNTEIARYLLYLASSIFNASQNLGLALGAISSFGLGSRTNNAMTKTARTAGISAYMNTVLNPFSPLPKNDKMRYAIKGPTMAPMV